MGKYCIVSYCSLFILPYVNDYIDIISKNNHCDLLIWNRENNQNYESEYSNCNIVEFKKVVDSKTSKFKKIIYYIKCNSFFKKQLKNNNYDGIVFLQTQGAVFCNRVLNNKYKKKYIVDIRDYTLENLKIYYRIEQKVLKNAYLNVISSEAYKNFLPKMEYILAHNYVPLSEKQCEEIKNRSTLKNASSDRIQISFIGTVRFFDMDKKLLDVMKNSKEFDVNYFGRGSDVLERYCEDKKIKNAKFHGSFKYSDTVLFYKETDIINNLYGNNSNFLNYALSNKLYHCAQLHLPILVCPNTYMHEITKKYNIGLAIDLLGDSAEKIQKNLYEWFNSISWIDFCRSCDTFLEKVKEDNKIFKKAIDIFANKGNNVT